MSIAEMLPYVLMILGMILLISGVTRTYRLRKKIKSASSYTKLSHARAMLVMLLNRLIHDDGEITKEHLEGLCGEVNKYFKTVLFEVDVVAETFQCRISVGKYFVTVDGYLKPPHEGKPYFIK